MALTRGARIDQKIQYGRGKAASALAENRYRVYRLNPNSTGQLVQESNLVYDNYPMYVKRIQKISETEAHWMIKVPMYQGMCDTQKRFKLQFGDLLLETGYNTDKGAFTFVYHRGPLRDNVFIGTPIPAQFSRVENNPTAINVGEVAYEGEMKEYELPLVLVNGKYSYSTDPEAIPAAVYVGIAQHERPGSMRPSAEQLPEDVGRQSWHIYSYDLPGIEVVERDIITGGNGDRYSITKPFWQSVGLRGYQFITERRLA